MRRTLALSKVTKPPLGNTAVAIAAPYHPRYAPAHRMTLSSSFDSVTEKNRYTSLNILLQKLSQHVGRRQYKMAVNLERYADEFRSLGIDWHDLKYLRREELKELLDGPVRMNHAERAALLIALEAKLCGVLCRDAARHSTKLCMLRGVSEHGWRCGQNGHTNDVYFEGKQQANPALMQLARRAAIARVAQRDGIDVEVRHQPDFSIVGRTEAQLNPRIWNAPEHSVFAVTPIGFEFRVHPEDPRAALQIEAAAAEWELHMNIIQQVVAEVLELYAVEREGQPLHLTPGEMGDPDVPESYSSAFHACGTQGSSSSSSTSGDVVTEHRMLNSHGVERPWFQAPLPQRFPHGIPEFLPFAPSIILRSTFRHIERGLTAADINYRLMQPVMDISCLVHPRACFWWNAEEEERSTRLILDYAKRMPFALPFNLYVRVDPVKTLRATPALLQEQETLLKAKLKYFNLRKFRKVWQASAVNDVPPL